MKYFILDCSSIAGMYNDSSINISYHNGNVQVQFGNLSGKNIGVIKPSCEGYINLVVMNKNHSCLMKKIKKSFGVVQKLKVNG